jgi:dynein heavy chain, axonemal
MRVAVQVMAAKKRYEVGLQKLDFTEKQVVLMQNELTALRPNLVRTVEETERLMATVQREKTEVVEPKKAIVDADVQKAEAAAAAANAIKTECEAALSGAPQAPSWLLLRSGCRVASIAAMALLHLVLNFTMAD